MFLPTVRDITALLFVTIFSASVVVTDSQSPQGVALSQHTTTGYQANEHGSVFFSPPS
jgi:hypothetical protein